MAPAIDAVIWAVALSAATSLRYDGKWPPNLANRLAWLIGVALVAQVVIGVVTSLYRVRWRIGSFEELVPLAETMIGVTIVLIVFNHLRPGDALAASALVSGGALALLISGSARSVWRASWERRLRPGPKAERAVVFGAGDGAIQVINSLLTSPDSPYVPVALLDDDPSKRHLRVRHLRVSGGRFDLGEVASREQADTLIIAIPSAGSPLIRELSELAGKVGLTVKVLPPVSRLFDLPVGVEDIRPIAEADLLGRRVIETAIEDIAGYLTGRRVLVTGAGGSIGSELCRQITRLAPERLIMLDRDESGIHQVQLSVEGHAMLDDRSLVVCDIRDREGLTAVFSETRPDVVFHAAALKHLPLLEMWPTEAVKTNVWGTQNVLDAAIAAGVKRFVNISTDKAANPCSILGYTKRLAERLTAGAGTRASGAYISTRFGNVLGSRGSVLTAFRAQIEAGGPVTVTHPDVTRYFMTVEEAVELVIQSGAVGQDGEVLVLDMGSPVRIAEVAERLVLESSKPIKVVYTGLRPAEKLHEQLFGDDEVDERRAHPLISHVTAPGISAAVVADLDVTRDPGDLRRELHQRCQVLGTPHASSQ